MSPGGDLAAMQRTLERDPGSLVFLSLGETHRRQGDLDAALTVAERGVSWYPEMAGAWDLLARIRSDRGEGDLAFEAWTTVLRLDPEHAGAHKGMAFLAFRAGELDRSLRYLRRAIELAPEDRAIQQVFERVGRESEARRVDTFQRTSPLTAPGWTGSALLTDVQGELLEGSLRGPDGPLAMQAVTPALAGLSRDAERTTRLLSLGPWQRISLGGEVHSLEIRSPTIDSLLVMTRPPGIGPDDLESEANRLATDMRHWLEALG
jgi:tetratricopeptide (TPR) repeat protein